MTVFIVWHINFNGDDEFIGVFSTEEKAQKRLENFSRFDRPTFRIEPIEVDEW